MRSYSSKECRHDVDIEVVFVSKHSPRNRTVHEETKETGFPEKRTDGAFMSNLSLTEMNLRWNIKQLPIQLLFGQRHDLA